MTLDPPIGSAGLPETGPAAERSKVRHPRHAAILWQWVLVPLLAAPPLKTWAAPQLSPLASAEVCGRCHRDILAAWKTSIHAKAMEDVVFQDCLEEARRQFGEQVQTRCYACHAPTVAFTGDTALHNKVSWEGVTCDFCHSISQVDLRNPSHPFRLQPGAAKFGPLKDAYSQGHAVSFSKVHTDPALCAGCHESRNSTGLTVLASYSEWLESSYASDRASCLRCHMAQVKARVVDPKVQRVKDVPVNLHLMPGGHSVEQLNKALVARVVAQRSGDRLEVKVLIHNRGAGHMMPTGSPLRKLILSMNVYTADGRHLTAERSYQRRIADAEGRLLSNEPEIWIRGAKVLDDNRLRPNEERAENFTFDVPRGQQARIQARFSYHYSPMDTKENGNVWFLTLPAIVSP